MSIIIIAPTNWEKNLAKALELALPGDTIIVDSDDQKQLAEQALVQVCPDKDITFEVRP